VCRRRTWPVPVFRGLAGAASVLAAGAPAVLHRELPVSKLTALARSYCPSRGLSTTWAGPRAFPNMLRVFKPTRR